METTNKRTNKHLTHSNIKQIHKGGKCQITLKFYYRMIPQMAWSQPGTRQSGISVKSTTQKDDMTYIRIIHWFSEQHIYNCQAWILETRNIVQAYIQILIIMILITETYKTVRHYLMAWLPKPSRVGGRPGLLSLLQRNSVYHINHKNTNGFTNTNLVNCFRYFLFSDAAHHCKLMSTYVGHQYANIWKLSKHCRL